jgi:DNA-directed RNA polymerase beta subunit
MDALGWGCIEAFLDETRYPRSKHVLEPYDAFLGRGVRDTIAAHNPLVLRSGKDMLHIYVGGDAAEDIDWRQATDESGAVVTPSTCRMLDLTYESDLLADVVCRWTSPGGRNGEKILEDVRIAGMPTMLHSSECFLRGMSRAELAAAGECPFDEGGYFVVEGQEKVVQAIDNVAHNTLLVSQVKEATRARTVDWEGVVYTKAAGDVWPGKLVLTLSHPPNARVTASFDLRASRRVKRAVSMPLFTAFRALGVDTDADIIALVDSFSATPLGEFLRPSAVEAGEKAGWTGTAAVQYLRAAMSAGQMMRTDDVEAVIADNFLAPAGDLRAAQLAMYVSDFLRAALDGDETDRDKITMKRVDDVGAKFSDLFRDVYADFVKHALDELEQELDDTRAQGKAIADVLTQENVARVFNASVITDHMRSALKGRWASPRAPRQDGVVHALPRASLQATAAYTNRVTSSMPHTLLRRGPRALYGDTYGFACPLHTPEGLNVGLVRHMCMLSRVSERGVSVSAVKDVLTTQCGVVPMTIEFSGDGTLVVLDDVVFGRVLDPSAARDSARRARRSGALHPDVSVAWSPGHAFHVRTYAGRALRPLMVVEDGKIVAEAAGWSSLMPRALEFVDAHESETLLIAADGGQLGSRTTHAELHGAAMLSTVGLMTPFSDHNVAPRNVFSCKQTTACASLYASNFAGRTDVSVDLLHHGQRPLVTTRFSTAFHADEMPYGENAIVAIMSFTGYNQEDGVVMNAAAVQRGLFETTHYSLITEEEHARERFAHPLGSGALRLKDARYGAIDGTGLPVPGSELHPGDVIVGKVTPDADGYRDCSLVSDVTVHGVVDKVAVVPIAKGARRCKVRLADFRQPTVGDKFSSRHGQKGIIGRLVAPEDMPWTESGLIPDVVINPHALPSRMTVGQILEALFAKAACFDGEPADATPFMNHGVEDARRRLGRHGDPSGDDLMHSGAGGCQLKIPTFVAPTYYMRLKQQVRDKVSAANGGRRMAVTGQPVQGRSNGGGIRMGEMEHDAMVAHGMAAFMKESYVERSDKPRTPYALVDGEFSTQHGVTRTYDRRDESLPDSEFFMAEVPVAFKTAVDELGAMGVGVKLGPRASS